MNISDILFDSRCLAERIFDDIRNGKRWDEEEENKNMECWEK